MLDLFYKLCPPARFYFIISFFSYIVMLFQNMGSEKLYCLGMLGCTTENSIYIFAFKAIYIVFWTWLLNIICQSGAGAFSWVLVLFPFILFFIFTALMLFE
jgi:hypothetical protein